MDCQFKLTIDSISSTKDTETLRKEDDHLVDERIQSLYYMNAQDMQEILGNLSQVEGLLQSVYFQYRGSFLLEYQTWIKNLNLTFEKCKDVAQTALASLEVAKTHENLVSKLAECKNEAEKMNRDYFSLIDSFHSIIHKINHSIDLHSLNDDPASEKEVPLIFKVNTIFQNTCVVLEKVGMHCVVLSDLAKNCLEYNEIKELNYLLLDEIRESTLKWAALLKICSVASSAIKNGNTETNKVINDLIPKEITIQK